MTQPIATYREQRLDGKRTFELFGDRVRVVGSAQFSAEFDLAIPLHSLNPEPMRLRIRHKAFWAGAWLLLGAVFGGTVLLGVMQASYASAAFLLVVAFGASGLVLSLATARKVEFLAFQSHAGLQVLAIARSGPDSGRLDSFIELIAQQVRAVLAHQASRTTS